MEAVADTATATEIILYHGTHSQEIADSIRTNGFTPTQAHIIWPANWFTLTTNRDQATRYGAEVIEIRLTAEQAAEYLYPGQPHTCYGFEATAYAVRSLIPASLVS